MIGNGRGRGHEVPEHLIPVAVAHFDRNQRNMGFRPVRFQRQRPEQMRPPRFQPGLKSLPALIRHFIAPIPAPALPCPGDPGPSLNHLPQPGIRLRGIRFDIRFELQPFVMIANPIEAIVPETIDRHPLPAAGSDGRRHGLKQHGLPLVPFRTGSHVAVPGNQFHLRRGALGRAPQQNEQRSRITPSPARRQAPGFVEQLRIFGCGHTVRRIRLAPIITEQEERSQFLRVGPGIFPKQRRHGAADELRLIFPIGLGPAPIPEKPLETIGRKSLSRPATARFPRLGRNPDFRGQLLAEDAFAFVRRNHFEKVIQLIRGSGLKKLPRDGEQFGIRAGPVDHHPAQHHPADQGRFVTCRSKRLPQQRPGVCRIARSRPPAPRTFGASGQGLLQLLRLERLQRRRHAQFRMRRRNGFENHPSQGPAGSRIKRQNQVFQPRRPEFDRFTGPRSHPVGMAFQQFVEESGQDRGHLRIVLRHLPLVQRRQQGRNTLRFRVAMIIRQKWPDFANFHCIGGDRGDGPRQYRRDRHGQDHSHDSPLE